MVTEYALLQVKEGQETAFEEAMRRAEPLIAASDGFGGIEVKPAAETSGKYLLLVRWESIEAHRDGFRRSERYQEWKALLHGFYEPMPEIEYFEESII